MTRILYRAIHKKTKWRKVSHHKTLENALRGKDGATALLTRTARVNYETHGDPIGVIVWEEGADTSTAVRINDGSIQYTEFPVEIALLAEDRKEFAEAAFNALFQEAKEYPFPEEVPNDDGRTLEGASKKVYVNRYERSSAARNMCLEHWGYSCVVCAFDFERTYGSRGKGFVHVHHVVPLSKVDDEYEVDPVNDLRPVCPNCHCIIHRYQPELSIEEARELLRADA